MSKHIFCLSNNFKIFFTSNNLNIRRNHGYVLEKTKHSLAGQRRREHDVNKRNKQEDARWEMTNTTWGSQLQEVLVWFLHDYAVISCCSITFELFSSCRVLLSCAQWVGCLYLAVSGCRRDLLCSSSLWGSWAIMAAMTSVRSSLRTLRRLVGLETLCFH